MIQNSSNSDLLKKELKIEQWPIELLIPYARNPRKNDAVVDKMVSAIKEFGFRIPIVAKSDGSVVDGHLRLKAAQKLGLKEVPVALADELTDAQVKAFRLLANKSANWAEWDDDLLKLELEELKLLDIDLELTGFDSSELDALLADTGTVGLTDPDDTPEVQEITISRPGDIWTLGNHRLMCGDSTKKEDVEKLLEGCKVDLLLTDPPYGMGLDTDYSEMRSNLKFAKDKAAFGGKKYAQGSVDEFKPEMIDAILNVKSDEAFLWGADYFAELLPDKNKGAWFVWDKRGDESADKMFGSCFELCWSKKPHKREVVRIKWAGLFGTEQEPDRKRHHPTQKPVGLSAWFIEKFSKNNNIVLDLFGGAGGTCIACEQTKRQCRMMELDPHYVDVIIRRWQKFTGKQAIHAESGKTFDEIAGKANV